jgi:cobalt-zinc-cadmium efflux system membrane fusion protein
MNRLSGIALFASVLAITGQAACRKPAPVEPVSPGPAHEDAHAGEALPDRVTLSPAAISEAGITTWQVKPVDLEHLLVLNGTVGHDENHLVQVAANVRGRIVAIPVDLGARVGRGDALVVIESVDLGSAREEFIREQSGLRVAARAYERAKTLLENKAISVGEFQTREGEYMSRKAAAQAAERALHLLGESDAEIDRLRRAVESQGELPTGDAPRLTLRAPFRGRVIDRKVTPGSLFEALQPLMTVADLRTVWVFLEAYEKDLALLHEGLAVTIRTEAYPHETFRGRVDFVGSVLETATRTVKLRATVDNGAEKLRPGMFVKAQVDVPKSAAEAGANLAVPQSALQNLEGRSTLFVQVQPGVFERRFVEIGHSFEGFTEVLTGVKADDLVVTEGSFVVKSEFAKASLAEEH